MLGLSMLGVVGFGRGPSGVRSGLGPGSGREAVSVSGLLLARPRPWVCASRAPLKDGVLVWGGVGGPRPWRVGFAGRRLLCAR